MYESAYDIIHKTGKHRVKLRIIVEYLCIYAKAIFFFVCKKDNLLEISGIKLSKEITAYIAERRMSSKMIEKKRLFDLSLLISSFRWNMIPID